ncbi:hypothetical protein JCM6882_001048 [Rhodosporidiobolus microsporus]
MSKPVPLEGPLPKIVVFDLDYTLWDCWCDTHVTPPMKRKGDDRNRVFDRYGEPLSFYRDVPALLLQLHHSNIQVWAASRTHAPKVARQILSELLLDGSLRPKEGEDPLKSRSSSNDKGTISAISLFDGLEIYPGSKMEHFREIASKTGVAHEDMLFFDDESRNREVTKLGVTFVLVPNGGTTRSLFETGLAAWRKGLSNRQG